MKQPVPDRKPCLHCGAYPATEQKILAVGYGANVHWYRADASPMNQEESFALQVDERRLRAQARKHRAGLFVQCLLGKLFFWRH